jgi:hypothetical protein
MAQLVPVHLSVENSGQVVGESDSTSWDAKLGQFGRRMLQHFLRCDGCIWHRNYMDHKLKINFLVARNHRRDCSSLDARMGHQKLVYFKREHGFPANLDELVMASLQD